MKKLLRRLLPLLIIATMFGYAFAADSVTVPVMYERYKYINITTQTTTIVKSSIGILGGIDVNGGTMGSITIYDNTSASGLTIATISSPYAGQVIPFGVGFANGLTIVTGAATNLTVVYW